MCSINTLIIPTKTIKWDPISPCLALSTWGWTGFIQYFQCAAPLLQTALSGKGSNVDKDRQWDYNFTFNSPPCLQANPLFWDKKLLGLQSTPEKSCGMILCVRCEDFKAGWGARPPACTQPLEQASKQTVGIDLQLSRSSPHTPLCPINRACPWTINKF